MNFSIYNFGTLLGFTFITGLTFYLFESTILNWIGMKGWLILIVIWLFGMPAVNIPVQFLNNFTRYAVYSWSPYRFSSEMFRDILYYNSQANFTKIAAVIIAIGIICLILLLLSMFKGTKKVDTSKDADNSLEVSQE